MSLPTFTTFTAYTRIQSSQVNANFASILSVLTGNLDNANISTSAAIARSKLASGTNYRILANNSSGVMSENAALTSAHVLYADANGQIAGEAQLSVSRGGTGAASLTANNVILGNGTSAVNFVAPGSNGAVLTSNGTTWTSVVPAYLTNPMTTLGDTIYEDATPTPVRLAGNTTTTKKYLSQTGNGSISAAPAWAALTAPTVQYLTSTGTTTGYLFTITTSSTVAVGDTYTNNGNTYTVLNALSAQSGQVLYMSQASAPQASGNLTRASGSGTATIAFTSSVALATYTTPASTSLIRVRMVGGGGGGGGGGSGSPGDGGAGGTTAFGASMFVAGGGSGGNKATVQAGSGGNGGTATITGATASYSIAGGKGGPSQSIAAATNNTVGGTGASTFFGGAGTGISNGAGTAGATNSGSGGGGGGGSTVSAGGGGGAGAFIEATIAGPASTYVYCIGGGGTAGTAGTTGAAGAAGGSGVILVEEWYQ